jgi:hypothetical protein
MKKNLENNGELSFEAELYNSLKFYGYLFPENVQEVEIFEQLYNKDIVEPLSFHSVLSKDSRTSQAETLDIELGLAAFSNPDQESLEFPAEETEDPGNND